MTTATRTETGTLRELFEAPGPFVSVNFDREMRPQLGGEAEARWQALARQLESAGADRPTLDSLTALVRDSLPGTGALAAFASGGEVKHSAALSGPDLGDIAESAPLPHLLRLLKWRQEHPAHVVCIVDRTGADLLLYPEASSDADRRTIDGPDDEIVRTSVGGMSQMRFQHRAEDSWEHNAAAAAEAVEAALAEVNAKLLLLAGDVRARQYLEKHLSQGVRREITVGLVSGSRSADGSASERAAQVEAETVRAGREQTAELLRQLAEERAPGGVGVEGVRETLGALAVGRLRVLMVTDDPQDTRTAWFGPGPTEVYARQEDIVPDGGQVRQDRLADVAVRAAVLTGAEVRVLEPGTPGAPAQGIGGICRFA